MRVVITKLEHDINGHVIGEEGYEELLEGETEPEYSEDNLPIVTETIYRLGCENKREHFEQIPDFSIRVMREEMSTADLMTAWSGIYVLIQTLREACRNQLDKLGSADPLPNEEIRLLSKLQDALDISGVQPQFPFSRHRTGRSEKTTYQEIVSEWHEESDHLNRLHEEAWEVLERGGYDNKAERKKLEELCLQLDKLVCCIC